MKILRIIYDFADKNVAAKGLGPGPYELSVAQGNRKDYEVFVLTGNLNGKNLKEFRFHYDLCNGKVHVYNLPRALWKFGPFLTSSVLVLPYYLFLKIFKHIDVVHNQQQMGVWFLLYKKVFGRLDKTPVVHSNHGPIIAREKKLLEQNVKLPFMTKYFEYPIHRLSDYLSTVVSDTLIAVSENTKNELIELYHPKIPIGIIENAVNTQKFTRDGKKEDFGFGKGSIILANGGRLSKRKNIDFIVESLKYLDKRYKLVIWGEWDEKDFKDSIDKIVRKNNLSTRYKYIGIKPYWIVDNYFRSMDVFVLPSNHEGLPKVVLEALSCGAKVVASGFKLEHAVKNLYMLQEVNPKTIADAVIRASHEKDYYLSTRKVIDTFYSWDSKAEEYHKVFKKFL